jgi:hypothetical protein
VPKGERVAPAAAVAPAPAAVQVQAGPNPFADVAAPRSPAAAAPDAELPFVEMVPWPGPGVRMSGLTVVALLLITMVVLGGIGWGVWWLWR